MAIPTDDGVSPFYWDAETGARIERATGNVQYLDDGEPVIWVEPEADPNESCPYEGQDIWAITTRRYDLGPETAVTIWVEAGNAERAVEQFNASAGYGMVILKTEQWVPRSQAEYLRWLEGREPDGNLAAVIRRQGED